MSGNCDRLFLTASARSGYRFGDFATRALWRYHPITSTTVQSVLLLGYGLDNPGFDPRQGQGLFSSTKVNNGSGSHPVSNSMGTAAFPREKGDWGVRLTTRFRLMPKLKTSGATRLVLPFAFMVGTTTSIVL
jgi:hypothetical protein